MIEYMVDCADDRFSALEVVERLRVVHSMIAVAQAEEVELMTRLYRLRRGQQLALGVGQLYAGEDAATEIGIALKVSQRAADGLIGLGLGLDQRYPAVREAFSDGRLDLARVRAISDTFAAVAEELVAVLEPRIVPYAENAEPQRIRRTLRRWLLEADPEGQAVRRKAAEAERYVKVTAAEDGTARLEGVLPAAGGQALFERLREMAVSQCCGDDPRTTSQRRADALVALADGSGRLTCRCGKSDCPRTDLAAPAAVARKALVQVGVSAETLMGVRDNPGLLAGFGAIDADLARQIARHARFDVHTETAVGLPAYVAVPASVGTACTASASADTAMDVRAAATVDTAVTASVSVDSAVDVPASVGTAATAAVAADVSMDITARASVDGGADVGLRYRPAARVAARVRALDGGCRAPGCGVPASGSDLDHQERFDHRDPGNGGRTVEGNLGCRCRRHHRLKTLADNGLNGWQVIHHRDRRVEWRTPSGGSITTTPEGAKFLFPRVAVPPVTAGGVAEAAPIRPLIDPGPVVNEMTELVHVYCTRAQRKAWGQARRTPGGGIAAQAGVPAALDTAPPF
ncbi:DUF222 domain-containing protein [Nocardia sp. NPDC051030]|uniref:HNH endonuclease signature motif containing protein n=1 Tax=Nocardia sp. NPDC051030 TaxID=3155162 RepID=UPI003424B9AC